MANSFDELVRRTEGLQPWRRVFHAATGVILVVILRFAPVRDGTALLFIGAILVGLVLVDVLRLALPQVNRAFFRTFSLLASPREAGRVSSSTWYMVGVFLAVVLFPVEAAMAGILVLALADPAASVVGRLWGRRKLGNGTVLGSASFALVAFLVLLFFAPWPVAISTAVISTVVESMPLPIDDNLLVTLSTAGALALLL